MKVPVVVRLEGTNVKEGRRMLSGSDVWSDVSIISADDLADAAEKAVAAAKGE